MPRVLVALVAALAVAVASPTDPPETKSLRVLTYNIHHGEGTDGQVDLPRLAKVITDARPDLVALQEVDDRTRRTGGVNQTAELARLSGLHGCFGKQLEYEGGGYGQAILARVPLDELKIYWLPGQPDRERRIAAEAWLIIGGSDLSFVTTHLHHNNKAIREQQARKLNELFTATNRTVILAGDLNSTPDEMPLTFLREKWLNATAGENLRTFPAGKPAKQLDYILVRPGGRLRVVERRAIDEPIASDHRPVLAVLEWTGK